MLKMHAEEGMTWPVDGFDDESYGDMDYVYELWLVAWGI